MKSLITIAIIGFFLPIGSANPQYMEEFRCLEWELDQDARISAYEVRSKLLSGVWTKTTAPTRGNQNYHLIVRFHPNGKASYMTQGNDGTYTNNLIAWSTEQFNDQHYLTLGEGSQKRQYLIEPFCEGVELIDINTGSIFALNYGEPADKGALLHRISQLYGTWTNVSHDVELSYPGMTNQKLETAKIRFSLQQDGTYSRQLWTGNSMQLIAEDRGTWNLSYDGKLIHFYPEGKSVSHLAEVKWFELDELVLEQILTFSDQVTVSGIRDLYFNKQ